MCRNTARHAGRHSISRHEGALKRRTYAHVCSHTHEHARTVVHTSDLTSPSWHVNFTALSLCATSRDLICVSRMQTHHCSFGKAFWTLTIICKCVCMSPVCSRLVDYFTWSSFHSRLCLWKTSCWSQSSIEFALWCRPLYSWRLTVHHPFQLWKDTQAKWIQDSFQVQV